MVAVPERESAFFPSLVRAVLGEAEVLQVGVSDAGHQRVSVQSRPRAAFEVTETQFLLELLMRLLAHPARFDGGGKKAQRDVRPEVAEVILALARCVPLADKPCFLAGTIRNFVYGRP